MTLNTTDSRIVYAGDGSTTVFAIPFKFLANGDVVVVLVEDDSGLETEWTEGTEYALSGAGVDAGGTLTVSTVPSDHTPQSDQHLVIYRDPQRTQGSALPLGGAFPSTVVERMADRLTMIAQRLFDIANRSIRQPDGDTTAMAALPAKVDRAGKVLGFDGNGDPAVSDSDLGDIDDILTDAAASATAAAASASSASSSANSASTSATSAAVSATAAANSAKTCFGFAVTAENVAVVAGTAKITYHMPFGLTLTSVFAELVTVQTSGNILTIDINEEGTTVLSTKLTIDNGEETSAAAATPAVISDAALAANAKITIDIDQIGDGTAKGLKVWLIGDPA